MNLFKYSILLFAICFPIPLFAQPTPHKRVHHKAAPLHKHRHPKTAALPFHDLGVWDWNDGDSDAAPFHAIRYLCQCLTGSPNPKPYYSLSSSQNLNLDLRALANQSVTGRHKAKAYAFKPKAKAYAFGWEYVGKYGDRINCVYDVKRATLTSAYSAIGVPHALKHRLYHVTLSVLEAAAREPIPNNGPGIEFTAPFASLLKYGAKLKP